MVLPYTWTSASARLSCRNSGPLGQRQGLKPASLGQGNQRKVRIMADPAFAATLSSEADAGVWDRGLPPLLA